MPCSPGTTWARPAGGAPVSELLQVLKDRSRSHVRGLLAELRDAGLPGSRVDKIAALADLVARLADHWKGARHGAIEFLGRSTTMPDSSAVSALCPALLRARQST